MTATTAPAARTYKLHARPAWRRILLTREMAIIALLVLVIVVALATVRNFDSPLTVTYLLRDTAPILLIALPMTLIIITEEIDLSVASIVGLSSVTTGVLHPGRLAVPGRGARRDRRRRWSADSSTASSSAWWDSRPSPSRSARSRCSAASPSDCSAPRRSPTSPSSGATSRRRTSPARRCPPS